MLVYLYFFFFFSDKYAIVEEFFTPFEIITLIEK